MAVLEPNEYDISYFDGRKAVYSHNAGYNEYRRWYRRSNDYVPTEQSTGEFFRDFAKMLFDKFSLSGKKVLDVGCAYGFVVEDLRSMGADAYGIDVSDYAKQQSKVQDYITVADARTYLKNYKNKEFDFLFSRWFLECLDPNDVPDVVTEMNRISKSQFHMNRTDVNTTFYSGKTADEWSSYNWSKGTVLVSDNKVNQEVTK